MSDEAALVPTEVRTVDFYGDEIAGALVQLEGDAQIYIPIRPICEYLGLSWSAQFERIQRDEVLASEAKTVRVTRTNESVRVTRTDSRRGDPDLLCLPLEFLPGWLFGISAERIKNEEVRAKIIRYRRECYRRLWDAFKGEILQSTALAPAQPTGGAALAYELATAVQNIAREQMQLEQRMGSMETSQDRARQWAKGIDARVSALEIRLDPAQPISETQAGELALHVKNVAYALQQSGERNGYQRVYGEMYRRYSIASYKNLPQGRFAETVQWLTEWYGEISKQSGTGTADS